MTTLLLLAMLFASDFHDTVSCTVQGYVMLMKDADALDFERADVCEGVRFSKDQSSLMLYSPGYWVQVVIPPEHGYRRFQYRWGSGFAHVGKDSVPIVWGYVEKG